ncbi:hypothetical protein DFH06DRAFT_686641 [Mycena polygramma]|nr:hypothetical protein DFH06DRAFT_686641 [Mycena polygramma]
MRAVLLLLEVVLGVRVRVRQKFPLGSWAGGLSGSNVPLEKETWVGTDSVCRGEGSRVCWGSTGQRGLAFTSGAFQLYQHPARSLVRDLTPIRFLRPRGGLPRAHPTVSFHRRRRQARRPARGRGPMRLVQARA